MIIYNHNNNHQGNKSAVPAKHKRSVKRHTKAKTSSTKRRAGKKGKSLNRVNTQFLKSLGLMRRKKQRK